MVNKNDVPLSKRKFFKIKKLSAYNKTEAKVIKYTVL